MIQELLPHAERIATKLKARGETISIAELLTAGLISAALLAILRAPRPISSAVRSSIRGSRAANCSP